MAKYWVYMGEYDAESTTFTEFAGGAGASPYNPDTDGTLKALRVMIGADAVTTLTEQVEIRLTCTKFKPNAIHCGAGGIGLATAPRQQVMPVDWVVDQEIKSGVPVKLEGRNITADTPVGVSVHLYGLIEPKL